MVLTRVRPGYHCGQSGCVRCGCGFCGYHVGQRRFVSDWLRCGCGVCGYHVGQPAAFDEGVASVDITSDNDVCIRVASTRVRLVDITSDNDGLYQTGFDAGGLWISRRITMVCIRVASTRVRLCGYHVGQRRFVSDWLRRTGAASWISPTTSSSMRVPPR